MRPSILIIYTGGTIGMVQRPEDGSLLPVNFEQLSNEIPQLLKFGYEISSISFEPALDSSNITPEHWNKLALIIYANYKKFDGFVVLHGTDTMSYTASALSFMLENLSKPVVFTGSQLPIGVLRTDGKENLLTAVEIAAAKKADGRAMVPEVCIYFDSLLLRGNRTSKIDSEQFRAFDSKNYPPLAKAGVDIHYYEEFIMRPDNGELIINNQIDIHVVILKIFPGISRPMMENIISMKGLKGIILESFGSGNIPNTPWMTKTIKKAVDKGIIVLNISQCAGGKVSMGLYETSLNLLEAGVISGYDMTTEAAVTKMMYLLGQGISLEEIRKSINKNMRGEITV
ncbi:MAG: asparaginase [Prolixibacteraceae bacterium]|nr:asparaginase [Prolixibacteraceae bacterium]